jgi:hypothetical protein
MYVVGLFHGIVVVHLNEAKAIPANGRGPSPEMMEDVHRWQYRKSVNSTKLAWNYRCSMTNARMH